MLPSTGGAWGVCILGRSGFSAIARVPDECRSLASPS